MRKLNTKQKALIAVDALSIYIINKRFIFSTYMSMKCYDAVITLNDYEGIDQDIERYGDDVQLKMKAEGALL